VYATDTEKKVTYTAADTPAAARGPSTALIASRYVARRSPDGPRYAWVKSSPHSPAAATDSAMRSGPARRPSCETA
jgi:hypothetical protein